MGDRLAHDELVRSGEAITDEVVENRRTKNRKNARKWRLRKRFFEEALIEKIEELNREIVSLRNMLTGRPLPESHRFFKEGSAAGSTGKHQSSASNENSFVPSNVVHVNNFHAIDPSRLDQKRPRLTHQPTSIASSSSNTNNNNSSNSPTNITPPSSSTSLSSSTTKHNTNSSLGTASNTTSASIHPVLQPGTSTMPYGA